MADKNIVYIYVLVDPDTQDVRYVGQTNNPQLRYKGHLNERPIRPTHKTNWVKSLRHRNQAPQMKIIDVVYRRDADSTEKSWIETYLKQGAKLTNTHVIGHHEYYPKRRSAIDNLEISVINGIRIVWFADNIFFSMVDITHVFGNGRHDVRQAWYNLKHSRIIPDPDWRDSLKQFPLPAASGKSYMTDCGDFALTLFTILSFHSPKSRDIKLAIAHGETSRIPDLILGYDDDDDDYPDGIYRGR